MIPWRRTTVALALASLVLTGCGRDDDDDTEEAAASISDGPATGTITVWAMGTEGEKLDVLAKDFEKENPEADVQVTAIPWDAAHDKISTAIAAKETPDVTMMGTTWMGEFAKTGALDPTPTDLIDKDQFFEGAWDTTVVDGTSYGVPWYVETRLIYYRKDLADKAGLSEPTNWQGLKDFAKGLEDKGGAEWGLNLQPGGTGSWQTFMPFAWQAGAELTNDDATEFTLDSPEMAEALEYYGSFFDEGLAPKETLAPGALESGFVDGSIGAFVSGPWHLGILKDQGGEDFMDKVGLAQMPKEKAGTSFVGGSDLAVFKDAKNRDGAWKFVEYLSRSETQQKWYDVVGDLPAVQSAWDSGTLSSDPYLQEFGTQLDDAKAPPAIPTWEQVADEIDGQVEAVVKGGTEPDKAAATMQQKAEAIGTGG